MKYLLQITRSTRADRPPESEIISDSAKYEQNDFDGMGQYHSGDNFFIVDSPSANQLSLDLIKILSTAPFNRYALVQGDGYLVIEYPLSEKWTNAQSLRSGSKAKVISILADTQTSEISYDTLAEAQSAISLLDPSDGYILIDDNPSEASQVIISRPVLWLSSYSTQNPPVVKNSSYHSSRDADRSTDRA